MLRKVSLEFLVLGNAYRYLFFAFVVFILMALIGRWVEQAGMTRILTCLDIFCTYIFFQFGSIYCDEDMQHELRRGF